MKTKQATIKAILRELLGTILFGLGYYTFSVNGDFAPGGISGTALLLHHLTNAPVGVLTIALNIPIILICMRYLDRSFLLNSIRTSILCAVIMDVVFPLFPAYGGQPMLGALFTGITAGLGLGIIYTGGSSTGGTDFVLMAVRKKHPHLSFGTITLCIDAVVILCGALVFKSIDAALYGLIATMTLSYTMDRVVNGSVSEKMALIVTRKGQETANKIDALTGRGSTLLPARGGYSGNELDMVVCACGHREIITVRRIAHQLDDHAMVLICDATEVIGEGFMEPELIGNK